LSRKTNKHGKKRLGWGFIILATVIFVVASGTWFLLESTREAKQLEQDLIDRFGQAYEYTPTLDGSIPAERMESFLRVRESLQPVCAQFQKVFDDIIRLDRLDVTGDKGQESSDDKPTVAIVGFKSIFTTPGIFLDFMNTRNAQLAQEEMGLGEYLYIYLSAYGEQLADESNSSYSNIDEAFLSPRARSEFIRIIENQLTALEASEPSLSQENLAADLRAEIEALKDGSHVAPWPDGAIGKTRESLAPYRERINDTYCSGIVRVELQQKNRGLNLGG
jgi:hypothetical protein